MILKMHKRSVSGTDQYQAITESNGTQLPKTDNQNMGSRVAAPGVVEQGGNCNNGSTFILPEFK